MRNVGRPNFTCHKDIREYVNKLIEKSAMHIEDLYLYPDEIETLTEIEKLDLMMLGSDQVGKKNKLRIFIIDPDTIHIEEYFEEVYRKYRLLF